MNSPIVCVFCGFNVVQTDGEVEDIFGSNRLRLALYDCKNCGATVAFIRDFCGSKVILQKVEVNFKSK